MVEEKVCLTPKIISGKSKDEEGFLASLRRAKGADERRTVRIVYGDWLEEQGRYYEAAYVRSCAGVCVLTYQPRIKSLDAYLGKPRKSRSSCLAWMRREIIYASRAPDHAATLGELVNGKYAEVKCSELRGENMEVVVFESRPRIVGRLNSRGEECGDAS